MCNVVQSIHRKVEDHNELTHHFLNCVTNHIELIRSKKRDFELRMTSYHVAAELDKEGLICLLANDSVRFVILSPYILIIPFLLMIPLTETMYVFYV